MYSIISMAKKDLLLLFRDRTGFVFTVGVPLLFAVFFGTLFGDDDGGSAIPLAVVDLDHSDRSALFLETLGDADELSVTEMTRDEAVDAVQHGELTAFVAIPEGFGEGVSGFLTGDAPTLELGVDPARKAEAGILEGLLTRYSMEVVASAFTDPTEMRSILDGLRDEVIESGDLNTLEMMAFDGMLSQADSFLSLQGEDATAEGTGTGQSNGAFMPVRINVAEMRPDTGGPTGPYDISFPQGIAWGLIAVVASFASSFVSERIQGTMIRLQMAPLTKSQVMAGKALACFLACMMVMVVVLSVGVLLFQLSPSSWGLLILGLVCVSLGFVGMMLVLSTLGRTERAVSNVSWTGMMVMSMFGGGMIPLFFMPEWMSTFSNFSPIKWAILAIEGGLWRGFSLGEMILPCGILLAIGAASFGLSVVLAKKTA
ncbi:MAG: ABC transporter permease [Myxococcales bacterium]|nr:ABC transporter permease [Myxococcales bacterium]